MNCLDWEERIALYAGGDLTGAEAAEVERHVADCAGCQVFWSGLRETLAELRDRRLRRRHLGRESAHRHDLHGTVRYHGHAELADHPGQPVRIRVLEMHQLRGALIRLRQQRQRK